MEGSAELQRKETSGKARRLISLYQEGKRETDEGRREKLAGSFYEELQDLLVGREGARSSAPLDMVIEIIYGESVGSGDYLAISTGTTDERVFFCKRLSLDTGIVESSDGGVRWMRYPKPSDEESWHAGQYWERWMEHFGGEVVDLSKVD